MTETMLVTIQVNQPLKSRLACVDLKRQKGLIGQRGLVGQGTGLSDILYEMNPGLNLSIWWDTISYSEMQRGMR